MTSFPPVDSYQWNWFLLESFCRLFSKQFSFLVAAPNRKNVGVIVRKSAKYDNYYSLMASAVNKSGIDLTNKAISGFLIGGHFIALNNATTVQKVVEQAQILRDSGV